jgi:thiol-disulfide isomerase/thioredoxin
MKKIIMFHGRECPHCRVMHPIVDRLIAEGCRIEKLEVWHDENNAKKMRDFSDIIRAASGGDLPVPTFLDQAGKRAICGEMSYEDLKQWINQE